MDRVPRDGTARSRRWSWRLATLIAVNGIQAGLLEWLLQHTEGPMTPSTWAMVGASGLLLLLAVALLLGRQGSRHGS